MNWQDAARTIKSKGSQAGRPAGLHQMAARRAAHQGQYFTPRPAADLVWTVLGAALTAEPGRKVHILDNACGNGGLFAPADPEQHALYGADVDRAAVDALAAAALAAGFSAEFIAAGMEHVRAKDFDVALINPPFSLQLSSPHLRPFACTTWGKHGPNTSALSQDYALDQALEAARIVGAILPKSSASALCNARRDRLAALLALPAGSFEEEGTSVEVCLAVFAADHQPHAPVTGRLDTCSVATLAAALSPRLAYERRDRPTFRHLGVIDRPTIEGDVTGSRHVRLTRCGRRISLHFRCALHRARVMNAVLRHPVVRPDNDHRYPPARWSGASALSKRLYSGQGQLDIEVHLAQADPVASLEAFAASLRAEGSEVDLDPQLLGYLRRRVRRQRYEMTPPRRFAIGALGDTVSATALTTHLADPLDWTSARVVAGETLQLTREAVQGAPAQFVGTTAKGKAYAVAEHKLTELFAVSRQAGFDLLHAGRAAAFPERARQIRARARALGLDSLLSWGYQIADLVEHAMSRGDICCWDVGLGKSRIAIALALINGGRHNLIVTEPHLVPELSRELAAFDAIEGAWQVINAPEQVSDLKRINVISSARLRMICDTARRRTYAQCLGGRINTAVVDEAHSLKSMDSQRTQGVWALRAKRRYALTATLLDNYPRDALEVVRWVAGDGTVRNPYGRFTPYLEPRLIRSMDYAERGVDRFSDNFIVMEWVTNQFAEQLEQGAKRAIPKLASPTEFRSWLAPLMTRRVAVEPEVSPYIRVPTFTERTLEVEWDADHLDYYLSTAEDFRSWWMNQRRGDGRAVSLVALLARINAVSVALNTPFRGIGGQAPFPGLTSKHRAALDLLEQWAGEGEQALLFAKSPDLLELMARHLKQRGIESVLYHGQIPIARRTRDLDERFRTGKAPVALISTQAGRTGLNIPQAAKVLRLTRDWSATVETQCAGRVLRPQQKRHVEIVNLELEGSLDAYQAQMVEFKRDAALVGIDEHDSATDAAEFEHLDTILGRFVEGIAGLRDRRRKRRAA